MAKTKKVALPIGWEEVCKHVNRDPNNLPDVSNIEERFRPFQISSFILAFSHEVINSILNPEYKADPTDSDCYRYYPVFEWDEDANDGAGAFRFWRSDCVFSITGAGSGAPLALVNDEACKHSARYFMEHWNNVLHNYSYLVKQKEGK